MKKTLKVSNITCANCALTIQNYFEKELSIDTSVHVTSKRVTFQVDEAKDDAANARAAGCYIATEHE